MEQLRPPRQMNFEASDLSLEWKQWKDEFVLYMDLSMDGKEDKVKLKMLKYLVGPQGRELYETIKPEGTRLPNGTVQDVTMAQALDAFEKHCQPVRNETVDRYRFFTRSQGSGESFDSFLTELKLLAAHCNFGDLKESLIRDRIVCGIKDGMLRERLLRESSLDLDKCVKACQASVLSKARLDVLVGEQQQLVHAVSNKEKPKNLQAVQCKFCGRCHERKKEKCPAFGKECFACNGKNHFSSVCRSKAKKDGKDQKRDPKKPKKRPVHVVEAGSSDEEFQEVQTVELEGEHAVYGIDGGKFKKKIFVLMTLSGKDVKFQVDCGATCNVIPKALAKEVIKSKDLVLTVFNQTTEVPLGKTKVKMMNPKNGRKYKVDCIVVDRECMPILGSSAAQQMGLIKVCEENIMLLKADTDCESTLSKQTLMTEYADVFEGTGKLEGEYHMSVDEDVTPVIHPPRRVPVALQTKLKEELDRLEEGNIIARIETHTPWVSSLVCVEKPNGKLRVCLDPRDLNKGLKRSHYPMTTIEDILSDLTNAKVFSTFDAKNGFWHVQLDESSSELTTFNTPYGRYRWKRMPFGLSTAPEEFQRRLNLVLEGLEGVRCVADDILVFGKGESEEEAIRDHDKKVRALMNRCRERNVKLNIEKAKLKVKEVSYIGHTISAEGLKPDPKKVEAVLKMPNPTDVAGVQRFIGFVNYLSKFLPGLSDLCEPLRKLTQKDVTWWWAEVHDRAVTEIKKLVTAEPVLQYYDPSKELTLQADASDTGLGAALMQEGRPVAFASRALTDTETRYAQIEKELLAVVFGLQRFHVYTYGRPVSVQSDHKPLEIITTKPLHLAPKRLQRMLVRMHTYDVVIRYKPGKEMYLADTLSRAYLQSGKTDEMRELETVNLAMHIPVSQPLLTEIREATKRDETMQRLQEIIKQGWPNDKKDVEPDLVSYFHVRDELSTENDLIFRGERLVIPKAMRREMTLQIHDSHIGVNGCLRRARECMYWPGMSSQLKDFVQNCETCQEYGKEQPKETLKPHDVPERPWAKVGADLFQLDGRHYLITVDYFSGYWEVDYLEKTLATNVISKLKGQFARFGIPDQLVTDNGPQFTADEFKRFARKWQFEHTTSSPHYPQSNGKAESSVKVAKSLLKKAKTAGSDPYLSLLAFRNTPTPGMGSSPIQRIMNRRTRTVLPTTKRLLKPEIQKKVGEEMRAAKERQACYYNRGARDLTPLKIGDHVRLKSAGGPKKSWMRAVVVSFAAEPRSYNVLTQDGVTYRRNRRHLRKVSKTTDNANNELDDLVISQPEREIQPVAPPQDPNEHQAQTTRSGRRIQRPRYLDDYVTR
ncbi:uncharacterized protein K02A2.6-like [Lytechinus pictus]|uniref:uncharacterized protein K02A2.6-like n=1 Tax=Lytechinus pictus TaxID=7653 RepID=UPI0030B9D0F2